MEDLLLAGFGAMGRAHFACFERLFASRGSGRWAAVVDPVLSPAGEKALEGRDVPFFRTPDEALAAGRFDGAVVATTTEAHYGIARRLLSEGIPVLLEKTFCGDLGLAERLVRLAEEKDLPLLPGFTERSHRALDVLDGAVDRAKIRSVSLRRLTPMRFRPHTIDPLEDLLVHDLEHLVWLLPGAKWSVERCVRDGAFGGVDVVRADLVSDAGVRADAAVGWSDAPDSERRIEIGLSDGRFEVDWLDGSFLGSSPARFGACRNDPLSVQAAFFLDSRAGGFARTRGRLESALAALRLLDACRRARG